MQDLNRKKEVNKLLVKKPTKFKRQNFEQSVIIW